jgi:hypothetical protein
VREISADEFIDCPSKALMSILEENTAFEELGIHVTEMSCTDPDYEAAADEAGEQFEADESPEVPARAHAEDEEAELDE